MVKGGGPSSQPAAKQKEKNQQSLKRKAISQPSKGKKLLKSANSVNVNSNENHKVCRCCNESTDNIDVLEDECVLACAICDSTFHGSCLKLEVHVIDYFPTVSEHIAWVCPSCVTFGREILKSKSLDQSKVTEPCIGIIQNQMESFSSRLSAIERSIAALSSGPSPSVASDPSGDSNPWFSVGRAKSSPTTKKIVQESPDLTNMLSAVHTEMLDKNKRKCNVVIYGLRPNDNLSDHQLFVDLCSNHLHIEVPLIKTTRRLGAILPDSIRHLLVTLSSEAEVDIITLAAKRLRSSVNSTIQRCVYINRDLTKSEARAAFLQRQKKKKPANSNYDRSQLIPSSSEEMEIGRSSTTSHPMSDSSVFHSDPSASANHDSSVFHLPGDPIPQNSNNVLIFDSSRPASLLVLPTASSGSASPGVQTDLGTNSSAAIKNSVSGNLSNNGSVKSD